MQHIPCFMVIHLKPQILTLHACIKIIGIHAVIFGNGGLTIGISILWSNIASMSKTEEENGKGNERRTQVKWIRRRSQRKKTIKLKG